jgi:hypothetical protein
MLMMVIVMGFAPDMVVGGRSADLINVLHATCSFHAIPSVTAQPRREEGARTSIETLSRVGASMWDTSSRTSGW